MALSPTIELARDLIQRPSVTPDDANCQNILQKRLSALGFRSQSLNFEDVSNLWSMRGSSGPLLVLAGHTDVVPTGPVDQWLHDPFSATVDGDMLYGRGAADMKGSLAAFVTAIEVFVASHPDHPGRIGLLITSDEEGPARWGTRAVVEHLQAQGTHIDYCVVGEPTSVNQLGDTIKVGRRGSLGATLRVEGIQGHIAYPHLADNPIHRTLPALNEIAAVIWDQGNNHFQPSSLQFSNISSGAGAANVIPGTIQAQFNVRFCPETSEHTIRQTVEQILQSHDLRYTIDWNLSGLPFETQQGDLVRAATAAVMKVTGQRPELSTSGGTSDGRFIAPTGAQVIELGPVNATIHQIDECVSIRDLDSLSDCYVAILENVLLAPDDD
ncbi:MAG: succinyl-diaminopimelate desuccinylase [Pseudomonadota bacterium]